LATATQEKKTFGIIHQPDAKERGRMTILSFFYEMEQTIRILKFYKEGENLEFCLKFLNDEKYKDDEGKKVTCASELVTFFEHFIPKSWYYYDEDGEEIIKALGSIKEEQYNEVQKETLESMLKLVKEQKESYTIFWADQDKRHCC
jgi:hypothetical protein